MAPNPTASPVQLAMLNPVQSYTVTVVANCTGGQTSAAATVSFVTRAGNDEPCTAVALAQQGVVCGTSTNGTTSLSGTTPANGYPASGCAGTARTDDVWYTFTTAATGLASTGATVTVTGNPANELRLFAAASCTGPFTELACSAGPTSNNTAAPPLVVAGLTPSTTYYVRVAGSQVDLGIATGPFTICLTNPPACGAPYNVALANITATTAQLSFAPGPGNTGYTLTLTPAGGGTPITRTLSTTTSPYLVTGLAALTTYALSLRATCGGAAATATFTTRNALDEPADAASLPVAATCQPTTGTAEGATTTVPNGYTNPGCSPFGQAPLDVWYTFTTPATGAGSTGVTITTGRVGAGIVGAGAVRVFRSAGGAAGPFTELACVSTTVPNAPIAPLILPSLTASTTYYVAVSPFSNTTIPGGRGSFTICVTPAPPCPPPTGLAAQALNNASAQLSWTVPAPGGTYTVEYGPTGFAPGTGAAGAVVVSGIAATTYTATGLSPATAYQFYVTRDCGSNGASTRSGPGAFQTLVLANDEPCYATVLPVNATCQPTTGTTAGATYTTGPTITYGGSSCFLARPNDVWYSFTTPASGPQSQAVMVSVTGAYARFLNVFSGSGCTGPLAALTCPADPGAGQTANPVVLRSLVPNTTYYVQVATNRPPQNPPGGPFSICVSAAPACDNPDAVLVNNITATSASLQFAPALGSTGYTVTTAPATTTQTVTTSPVALTGLSPSTSYVVTLQGTCAVGQSAAIAQTFTTTLSAPANDLCANATPIQCGQTLAGTTVGSTATGQPIASCNGGPNGAGNGVFYSLIGTGDSITVTNCVTGNNTETRLLVYSGSCSGLVCVNSSSFSTCPIAFTRPQVKFLSQSGITYYVLVTTGNTRVEGPFLLSMRCRQAACPAPTTVTVSAASATTANVSFSPATGSSPPSYTVTATPSGGGTAVTATGTAAPLPLTGLLPNTSYVVTVVANCPINNPSPPSASATFTTPLAGRAAVLAASVGLFSNPAHHSATLLVPAALLRQPALLSLADALGRTAQQWFVSPLPGNAAADARAELNLTGLPPGVYTLRLLTSEGPIVRQLLVE